jgi:general secretion pathway protein D
MRITHDESTNSLVIIANSDDFRVVKQVIDKLDIRRRQVLIDAVILELASSDELDQGVAYHGPFQSGNDTAGIMGGQFNATSLGLSQDLLSGLALGVFGPTIDIPFGTGPTASTLAVPAFGIVIQALRTNSSVDIVSNPQLLTLDNEEASIVVGRKVPFPTNTSFSQLGVPIVSYQREDVATTLKVTPRVNSSNQVTLEVTVEVAEVEEDNRGLDASQAGFITSKREIETTALVGDNETVVLGGLVGMTDTTVETKVPILGDIPVLGVLFRGSRVEHRKSNLMVFLTPHIVDDDEDMLEIMKVKEAQRQEFIRRFYGKSRDVQMQELQDLLRYSMNFYGEVPVYSGPDPIVQPEPIGPGIRPDVERPVLREPVVPAPVEPVPQPVPENR